MGDFYAIYLVNTKEKRYETFYCDSDAERYIIEKAAKTMASLFGLDNFRIKYMEPDFD